MWWNHARHAKEGKLVHSIEQSLASSTLRCAHAVFLASLSSLAYIASLGLFRCSAFVGALAICRTQCVARVQNRICSFNLNIRYMVVLDIHTYIHVHASRNAVTLVWGLLRLAPKKEVEWAQFILVHRFLACLCQLAATFSPCLAWL